MERELIEADLAEFIEGETWPEPDEQGDPTPLPDPTSVSGVLRRMKRLDREAAQINEVAKYEVERIKAWQADRLGIIAKDVSWAERALENFMVLFNQATKKKSLALADGTLKLTGPSDRVVVVDETAFLEWAIGNDGGILLADAATQAAHPEVLRAKYEPDKTAIKKLETGTAEPAVDKQGDGIVILDSVMAKPVLLPGGELVPGVEIRRDVNDRFNVTLGDD